MTEALELGDQALGLAFGVAFAKVIAAEVAIQLTVGEHGLSRDHVDPVSLWRLVEEWTTCAG